MGMEQEEELQELNGTVESVLYSNEENGYAVLRVRDENGEMQTVVGCFPFAAPGEAILASGAWVNHQVHGRQFRADFSQRLMPDTSDTIFEYLSGGVIRGIGPATASMIVNTFGSRSLDIIENHPDQLSKIKGISLSRAKEFSGIYRKQTSLRKLIDYICAFSVRPVVAIRLYRFYGDSAIEILQTDPYIITALHIGGTFAEADEIALQSGFHTDSPERIRAAAIFELSYNMNNGHCFIPFQALSEATASLISADADIVADCIAGLAENGGIVREEINGKDACYLPELYRAECYVAQRLVTLSRRAADARGNTESIIATLERRNGIEYAPAQTEAIETAVASQVLVITGGPGTGKTTTTRAIIDVFDKLGLKTMLTAPTGRAAKRMSELSGREAQTVHRLIGAKYSEDGDKVIFTKNEDDKLACDAVILDETSMVDILLMEALLKAMPDAARLILVGDADQLPSVGPGNLFKAVINSGIFPVIRLKEIFRQSENSLIVRNAHLINEGQYPDFGVNTGDFFRLKRLDAPSAIDTITELCAKRLPEKMKIAAEDIQVLSPTRKGELGTINLNRCLQAILNPASKEKREKTYGDTVFRVGDRVMQIRNNYDILWHDASYMQAGSGVYNGDIGYIVRIDTENEILEIEYDGKIAEYAFAMMNEIEHAWAITVHKSQGCEFKAVILALSQSSKMLMTRSVLYTAVTRAKNLLIMVGDDNAARAMIDNNRQTGRYTFLKTRICGAAR